ncbi:response regulator transcription factor [Paenibacillus agricola]|uniref:Response regulator n=1 Tax=Paenibacillus agricola TaxID=2716264 RepID=A0ABX0J0X6_9BACL|nr:response regulator [Paenibacillus agricola]NHN29879.1 response regulator [Paenibacillus agricola]
MLKVLIVDDNALSRTDLKTMIIWESNGFYISGEASNGINALKLMEDELPDIVITDINMPLMNGIELIDYLEQHSPQVRIIALSAYDDFDYVRQSMKKGALDYVLKHQLDAALLLEILQAARSSILKYRNERDRQNEISVELSYGKAFLRQEFIHRLIEGSISNIDEIKSKLCSLDIQIDTESLIVTVAEIDDYRLIEEKFTPIEVDVLIKTLMDISIGILGEWEKSVIVHTSKGKFILIFSIGKTVSTMYIYNRIYTILNRIRSEIKKYLNITACFGVSKVCKEVLDLRQAYHEADSILKDKFYKGKNGIFIENTSSKLEEGFFCLDIKDEKAIYSALKNLDVKSVERLIEEVFKKISSLRLSSKSTQMICAELINIVNKVAKDTGIEISKLYISEDIPYNMIQKYETLMDIKDWILGLNKKLISILERTKIGGQLSEITKKAVGFIHRNYKTDFSLGDVADFVGVSNSYISRLFREECKMGFVEYLNHVRVENAKQYIENGELKLKEIVSCVGFNNYNYFFKVFKETTGMTPLEYEQICRS